MNNHFIASITALVITTGIGTQQMNAAGSEAKQQITAAQTRLEALQKERGEWQARVNTLEQVRAQTVDNDRDRLLEVFDKYFDEFVTDFNQNHTRRYSGGFGVEAYRYPSVPGDAKQVIRAELVRLTPAEANRLMQGADALRAKDWYMSRPDRAKSYSKGWLSNKTGRYNHTVTGVDVFTMLFLEFMVAEGKL